MGLVCQVLDSLMEQRAVGTTENYIYFNPSVTGDAGTKRRDLRNSYAPFRKAITFITGGASYVEAHSLQTWAQARGRHVTFGSTDMVAPDQLLDELSSLGSSQDLR